MVSLIKSLSTHEGIRNRPSARILNLPSIRKSYPNPWSTILIITTFFLSLNADADSIIAKGNFDTGNSNQWHLWRGNERNRQFKIVNSPLRQGKYAARFEVRNGDRAPGIAGERSEVSNLIGGKEIKKFSYKDFDPNASNKFANRDGPGDDYYYAWSSYFPEDFPDVVNWGVITQWHEAAGGTGSTNLAVRVSADQRLVLTHNTTTTKSANVYEILPKLRKGVWNDFIVRVKWSCSNDGILELWHKLENEDRYVKKVSQHNIQTAKFTTYCNPVYKLQGFYRSANNTATHVIYHDGFVQGKTFEVVAQKAHNSDTSLAKILPPSNIRIMNN